MRNVCFIALVLMLALLVGSCKSGGYQDIEYVDPGTRVTLTLSNSPTDLHAIADAMVTSILSDSDVVAATSGGRKPAIMVGRVQNRTHEHWDVKSLTDKIRTCLVKSDKFRVLDETARPDLAEEYEYQASGFVDPETRKGPGKQIGVDWFLRGDLVSQVHKGGDTKVVWYKITMQLTDVATNEIIWTEDKELMKKGEKPGWGW